MADNDDNRYDVSLLTTCPPKMQRARQKHLRKQQVVGRDADLHRRSKDTKPQRGTVINSKINLSELNALPPPRPTELLTLAVYNLISGRNGIVLLVSTIVALISLIITSFVTNPVAQPTTRVEQTVDFRLDHPRP